MLSVEKTVAVYDVSVRKQKILLECYEICMHMVCFVSTQTGESVASFDLERQINCFTFIQVYICQ